MLVGEVVIVAMTVLVEAAVVVAAMVAVGVKAVATAIGCRGCAGSDVTIEGNSFAIDLTEIIDVAQSDLTGTVDGARSDLTGVID